MNKNIIRIYLIVISIFIINVVSVAQDSQTLYFMNRVPQSTFMNPAIQPKCNFFFGLPVVSSVQVGVGNNRLSLTDVVMKHPSNDSLITFLHPDAVFNQSDFLAKLDENNFYYEDFSTDLLSFGFRTGEMYFTFNISEKFYMAVNYPKDLMEFALKGNEPFINQTVDLNYLGINASFYREYGLGVSRNFGDNLSVGARVKLLYGHANVYSDFDKNKLSMYSSADSIYLNADATFYTSSPMVPSYDQNGNLDGFNAPTYFENSEQDSIINLAMAHNNRGFGIDVGVYYKPIDRLALSLSIIDFGFIKWDVKDVTLVNLVGSYSFKGVDLGDDLSGSESDDPFQEVVDSLENSFTTSSATKSYKTYLGTKIYVGASYLVSNKFDVGFLSRSYILNGYLNQAFTLSANVRPLNGLSASLSYSIMNGSYNNIGFGLVLGGAPFQLYVISDNASAAFWGHKTTSFNLRFGLNFALGCRESKRAKDTPLLKSVF